MAAAVGVGAIVAAVIAATVAIGKAAGKFVDDLGGIAAALASADTDFTKPLQSAGGSLREMGDKLLYLGSGMGIAFTVVGASLQQFGRVLNEINQTAERYAQVNPQIAIAEAMGEVQQIVGDLRRGQMISPALTQYIQTRTEVQQRFEDIKIRALQVIVPLATRGLEVLDGMLIAGGKVLDVVTVIGDILSHPGDVDANLAAIRRLMEEKQEPEITLPTDMILSQQLPQFLESIRRSEVPANRRR